MGLPGVFLQEPGAIGAGGKQALVGWADAGDGVVDGGDFVGLLWGDFVETVPGAGPECVLGVLVEAVSGAGLDIGDGGPVVVGEREHAGGCSDPD